ncbi:MAG: hypothetical protein VKJ04_09255 [Vampirovibrionales bacterium]|nr:hypothetical protein [Vampirovibrionales bacterium]
MPRIFSIGPNFAAATSVTGAQAHKSAPVPYETPQHIHFGASLKQTESDVFFSARPQEPNQPEPRPTGGAGKGHPPKRPRFGEQPFALAVGSKRKESDRLEPMPNPILTPPPGRTPRPDRNAVPAFGKETPASGRSTLRSDNDAAAATQKARRNAPTPQRAAADAARQRGGRPSLLFSGAPSVTPDKYEELSRKDKKPEKDNGGRPRPIRFEATVDPTREARDR